jgi:putative membrane protein
MMWWWNTGWSWWGWFGMTLSMVVVWGLVIWAVIMLVRYLTPPANKVLTDARRDTPGETLANRFARGEIDEQEYEHRLAVLLKSSDSRTSTS